MRDTPLLASVQHMSLQGEREREREREGGREGGRERECVCVCSSVKTDLAEDYNFKSTHDKIQYNLCNLCY